MGYILYSFIHVNSRLNNWSGLTIRLYVYFINNIIPSKKNCLRTMLYVLKHIGTFYFKVHELIWKVNLRIEGWLKFIIIRTVIIVSWCELETSYISIPLDESMIYLKFF